MNHAARVRRVASAISLILGPVLLFAASVIQPWNATDDTAETLQITADHVTATQVSDLFAFLGLLAMIPATFAVMRILRNTAPLLGLVGGAVVVAGLMAAMVWPITNQVNIGFAEQDAEFQTQVAAAFDGSTAWVIELIVAVFLLGLTVGLVALGIGLMRGRVVPAWVGAAVVAVMPLSILSHIVDQKAVDVVSSALLLVGFAGVAWFVASVGDLEWESATTEPPSEYQVPATGASASLQNPG